MRYIAVLRWSLGVLIPIEAVIFVLPCGAWGDSRGCVNADPADCEPRSLAAGSCF